MSSIINNIKDQIQSTIISPLQLLPKWQKYTIISGIGLITVSVSAWGLFEVSKNQKCNRKYQNPSKSIPEYEAKLKVKCDNLLGECPIWDNQKKLLYWIDEMAPNLWTYDPKTNETHSYPLPEPIGSFCLTNNNGFIMSFSNGPAFYNPITNNGRPVDPKDRIFQFEPNRPITKMNDGRVDRRGRFVVGGFIDISPKLSNYAVLNLVYQIYNLYRIIWKAVICGQQSAVYRLNIDLSHEKLIDNVMCTNSICFSPNGNKMYVTDTVGNNLKNDAKIMEYKYDTDVFDKNACKTLTKECCNPDGACVDADGYIWSANCGTGKVVRYDPNGNVDLIVKVPSKTVTCCAFGGEELDELFITTLKPIVISSFEFDPFNKEINGNLYSVKIKGIKGLKENRFLGFSL